MVHSVQILTAPRTLQASKREERRVKRDVCESDSPRALRPSAFSPLPSLLALSTFVAIIALTTAGCSRGPEIVPVRGKVLYNGEPLAFGSVMFQPPGGQPARATIQSDGSFVLTTEAEGDGATVGPNRVRITSYEAQNPAAASEGEARLGKLLIPRRYTDIDTSGISVEVPRGGKDDIVIELTDEVAE